MRPFITLLLSTLLLGGCVSNSTFQAESYKQFMGLDWNGQLDVVATRLKRIRNLVVDYVRGDDEAPATRVASTPRPRQVLLPKELNAQVQKELDVVRVVLDDMRDRYSPEAVRRVADAYFGREEAAAMSDAELREFCREIEAARFDSPDIDAATRRQLSAMFTLHSIE